MRWIRVLSLSLLAMGISVSAVASEARNPSHAVFLIHGLGGDASTFCEMDAALKERFPGIDVVPLIYDTRSNSKGPIQFAQQIHNKIIHYYRDRKLPLDTPFSMIMHSQGGIVGRQIVMDCLIETPSEKKGRQNVRLGLTCDPKNFPKNLKHFITLGTPHWGSSYAVDLTWLPKISRSKIPKVQIKQLQIGSTTFVNDRLALIGNKILGNKATVMPEGARFVSIAGNLGEILDRLQAPAQLALDALANSSENENDLVVALTYGHPDFNYYVERMVPGQAKAVEKGKMQLSDESYVVRMPHVQLISVNGMACVAKDNANEHVAFQLVARELNRSIGTEETGRAVQERINALGDQFGEKSSIFASELVLHLPDGYQRDLNLTDENIKITASPDIETAKLQNSRLSSSFGFNTSDSDKVSKHYVGFFHSGRFKLPRYFHTFAEPPEAQVCYEISIPGFEKQKFCVMVSPSKATFSRVMLKPLTVFPLPGESGSRARLLDDGRQFIVGVVRSAINPDESLRGPKAASLKNTDIRYYSGRFEPGFRVYSVGSGSSSDSLHEREVSLEEASVANITDTCAVATVASHKGVHKGGFFKRVSDAVPAETLEEGSTVEIRGRFKSTAKDGEPVDRFFVTTVGNAPSLSGMWSTITSLTSVRKIGGWVNRADVDIDPTAGCSF